MILLRAISFRLISCVLVAGMSFAAVAQTAPAAPSQVTLPRPLAELRAEALKAQPPSEAGPFLNTDLVEIGHFTHLDIRLATANNLFGAPIYRKPRVLLQKDAAQALQTVANRLKKQDYGLLVYDAYHPWFVTRMLWDALPEDKHEFVEDPARGSIHNRGCAVDLTLLDLRTKKPLPMPSEYGDLSTSSYANYMGGTDEQRKNRQILRDAMEQGGFIQKPSAWWHYDYKDCQYALMNFASIKPDTFPKILSHTNPRYTDQARDKKVNGVINLRILVGADGKVQQATVVRRLGYGLDEEAIKAVKQWTFKPGLADGVPFPMEMNVEINFHPE